MVADNSFLHHHPSFYKDAKKMLMIDDDEGEPESRNSILRRNVRKRRLDNMALVTSPRESDAKSWGKRNWNKMGAVHRMHHISTMCLCFCKLIRFQLLSSSSIHEIPSKSTIISNEDCSSNSQVSNVK